MWLFDLVSVVVIVIVVVFVVFEEIRLLGCEPRPGSYGVAGMMIARRTIVVIIVIVVIVVIVELHVVVLVFVVCVNLPSFMAWRRFYNSCVTPTQTDVPLSR